MPHNTDNARRDNYARRALAMRQHYGMKWSRRESMAFVDRLVAASANEGIDDMDLRVLVRLYNREIQWHRK